MTFMYEEGRPIHSEGVKIEAKDLSTLTFSEDDHDRLYHHDGTGTITLVDGTTTTAKGHYTFDFYATAGSFRPILDEATHLGGLTRDEFTQVSGDEMNGPLTIDTDDQDALLELLATGTDDGTIAFGASSGSGAEIRYDTGSNELRFGELSSGTFTANFVIEMDTGNTYTV